MTPNDLAELLGKDMAARAKQAALGLFERESEIMRARGLILIDTKYAFGLDRDGVLHVINEVNTPDSSRLCDVEEWEANYCRAATATATGRYNTVTALLEVQSELTKCVAVYGFRSRERHKGAEVVRGHGCCKGCVFWTGTPKAAALA